MPWDELAVLNALHKDSPQDHEQPGFDEPAWAVAQPVLHGTLGDAHKRLSPATPGGLVPRRNGVGRTQGARLLKGRRGAAGGA